MSRIPGVRRRSSLLGFGQTARSNRLCIMTDQLLNADLSPNGHPELPTSAMVRFAAAGVSFVQSDATHLARAEECGA